MSAHVILNLLNELRKRDKMRNKFNKHKSTNVKNFPGGKKQSLNIYDSSYILT